MATSLPLPDIVSPTVREPFLHEASARLVEVSLALGARQTGSVPLHVGRHPQAIVVLNWFLAAVAERELTCIHDVVLCMKDELFIK